MLIQPEIKPKEHKLFFSPKQTLALDLLDSPEVEEMLYGGAKGGGKLQPLDTKILTPKGFRELKSLKVGDFVIDGETGVPVEIEQISHVQKEEAIEFTLSDKTKIISGVRHLWKTMTAKDREQELRRSTEYRESRKKNRLSRSKNKRPDLINNNKTRIYKYKDAPKPSVKTTQEIANTLQDHGVTNHSINQHYPIQFPEKELEIEPYTLGAWLGDGTSGSSGITGIDPEIFKEIEKDGYEVTHNKTNNHVIRGLQTLTKKIGLYKNKHIPEIYLLSSLEQRLSLIQGLMDTDGWCEKDGSCKISLCKEKLFNDTVQILRTLGIIVNVTEGFKSASNGKIGNKTKTYTACFVTNIPMFRLKRKLIRQNLTPHKRYSRRFIVEAKSLGVKDMVCLGLKSTSKMYLAGENLVPTHNSVFMCEWAFLQAQKLIHEFGLSEEKRKNPIPVGYMGRKRGVDFTKTTLETWKKFIPPDKYRIRPMDKEIIIDDRVKIFYGGMDDEANVNKMNSAEFSFICIDQAEEISRDDLGLMRGTLRLRWNDHIPAYKILLTANPAPSFLKTEYIDNPPKDGSKVFIQALPSDNPFLDDKYVKRLYDAFKHRPELIRAYVHGSWDDLEGLDTLIKSQWVNQCIGWEPFEKEDIRVTAADVARYGHDETVIYNFVDYKVVGENISGINNTETNAARIVRMAAQNNSDIIVIDGDAYGGGVVDVVRGILANKKDNRMNVLEINSGKRAQDCEKYANTKTEIWFHAADLLAEKKAGLPKDNMLAQDLTVLKYKAEDNGIFKVESKKDVRRRVSRSPDRGDAFVYGLWGHKFVPKKKYDYHRYDIPSHRPQRGGYGWNSDQSSLPTNFGFGNSKGGYGWV